MQVTEYYMEASPDVVIVQNPLTNDWFIEGQKNETMPYVRDSFKEASQMYQAIAHFNATGDPKPEDKFGALTKSRFKKRKVYRGESKAKRNKS